MGDTFFSYAYLLHLFTELLKAETAEAIEALLPGAINKEQIKFCRTTLSLVWRLRSKGSLSRDGMLLMKLKIGQCAEKKWRRLRGFEYLAKVVTEMKFKDGVEVTGIDQAAA